MLLTCPTCRSGLQVPEGTTAHVRCPACKTVFPAEAGLTPAEVVEPPRPEPPRRRPAPAPPPEPTEPVEPDRPRPVRRNRDDYSKYTPEERAVLRGQFTRGMWGCRLVSAAYGLQAIGLLLVVLLAALNTVRAGTPALIAVAGVCGFLNLILVPIGLALILSGRPAPGLYRFGVAAGVAVLVHGVFVLCTLAKNEPTVVIEGESQTGALNALGHLVTKLDSLTLYLTWAAYPDESPFTRRGLILDVLCGLAEMVRLILLMVTLAGVARGAGDTNLAYRCIRAGGVGSVGPAGLAVAMGLFLALMIESGGRDQKIGQVLLTVAAMGIYAILAGTLVPASVAARDAAEACEFPYQSQNFEIGD